MRNELQAAVEFFKERITAETPIAEGDNLPQGLVDMARHSIKLYTTALVALREQMKRSEGCEFCRPNDWEREPLGTFEIIRDDYSIEEHEIGIDDFDGGYRIATTIMFHGPSFDINYCPVCGRQLFGNSDQAKEGGE